MASEIEDHILWGDWESPGSICWGTHTWAQEQWWGQDRGWQGQGQGDRRALLSLLPAEGAQTLVKG